MKIIADQDRTYKGMVSFTQIADEVCTKCGLERESVLDNIDDRSAPEELAQARLFIAYRLRTERACLLPEIARYLNTDEPSVERALLGHFGTIPQPTLEVSQEPPRRGPGRPRKVLVDA